MLEFSSTVLPAPSPYHKLYRTSHHPWNHLATSETNLTARTAMSPTQIIWLVTRPAQCTPWTFSNEVTKTIQLNAFITWTQLHLHLIQYNRASTSVQSEGGLMSLQRKRKNNPTKCSNPYSLSQLMFNRLLSIFSMAWTAFSKHLCHKISRGIFIIHTRCLPDCFQ